MEGRNARVVLPSEAAADRAELVGQVGAQDAEAEYDNGDDDAGDQPIFQSRDGTPIKFEFQPNIDISYHRLIKFLFMKLSAP